jgi:hypothetical protein
MAAMERAASQGRIATPEQHEAFQRDGYLVVDSPGWDLQLLDGIVADLDSLYEKERGPGREENGVLYRRRRIRDAWRVNEKVKSLALDAGALALLEDLYGRKPLPFQTLNFNVGTEQAPHSDTIHFNSIPPGFMAGVWVALEDIDMGNGPLVYYPGSHQLPEWSMQDVGSEDYKEYERFIADSIKSHGLEPEYGIVRKGQAIIWSANLLHGGSEQTDRNRSRHSHVTHYFFADCEYYRPLQSTGEKRHQLHPEWIH